MTITGKPGCQPTGVLAPWPMRRYVCADQNCRAILHPIAVPLLPHGRNSLDRWNWFDENGSSWIDYAPTGYREDPEKFWSDLYQRFPGTYSNLRATLALNAMYFWHAHRPGDPAPGEPEVNPDTVPFCHKEPMYAGPDGWVCRVMRTTFPYVEQT